MSVEERRVHWTQPCEIFSNPLCSSLVEKASMLLLLAFNSTLIDYLAEGKEGHLSRWGTLLVSGQMSLPSHGTAATQKDQHPWIPGLKCWEPPQVIVRPRKVKTHFQMLSVIHAQPEYGVLLYKQPGKQIILPLIVV